MARAEGRATAATLRAAGMNVDLAPVVDVVRPESALHAEGRGFGFSARSSAARFGAAFTRGLRAGGVAATAKHFPGFGAAPRNTDLGGVRIGVGLRELRGVDRVPFAAAVRAGADLVMLSSATYPALSRAPGGALPARGAARAARRAGLRRRDDLRRPRGARLRARTAARPARRCARRARASTCCSSRAPTTAPTARRGRWPRALRAGRVDRGALEASLARVLALRAALR